MKFFDEPQPTKLESDADRKASRRGMLRKLLESSAAFAVGLFAVNRASASSCGCSPCNPGPGAYCWVGWSLCYEEEIEQYVIMASLHEGTPIGGCCEDYYSFPICSFVCLQSLPCGSS